MAYQPEDFDRDSLINLLAWNDCNGIYRDADVIAEGFEPLSRADAIAQFDCYDDDPSEALREWMANGDMVARAVRDGVTLRKTDGATLRYCPPS